MRDYRNFLAARFFLTFGYTMMATVVGWHVYAFTHDMLSLGLIGLAEAAPFIITAVFGGHTADVVPRKKIIAITTGVYLLCAGALLALSFNLPQWYRYTGVLPIYAVIFITGIARGFMAPAQGAFVSQLVPRELYVKTSTLGSIAFHISAISGPAAAGLAYAWLNVHAAYGMVAACTGASLLFLLAVRPRPLPERAPGLIAAEETLWQKLSAGLRYVFRHQVLFGALALDMFSVLFGGAVAMLPVFAKDVLHTGPQGLGFLRSAPAVGSLLIAGWLAWRPPHRRTGRTLLTVVAGFGVCMILFALSQNFLLSLGLLALSGMFDGVSVVIRSSIVQLYAPDHIRGRVEAVNRIFIGSSNEIGSFESGLAARLLGLVPSVVFGGCMTLLVVGGTALISPRLRRMDRLTGDEAEVNA